MYKAIVNGEELAISSEQKALKIDGRPVDFDCELLPDGTYHILLDNQSLTATAVSIDRNAKRFDLTIDGKHYSVELEDEFDLLLTQMGMDKSASQKISEVKSPMPGLVLEIKVKVGDQILKDQPVMVLEAMKMENVISAPCDATIASVEVSEQEKVDKNHILVKFE